MTAAINGVYSLNHSQQLTLLSLRYNQLGLDPSPRHSKTTTTDLSCPSRQTELLGHQTYLPTVEGLADTFLILAVMYGHKDVKGKSSRLFIGVRIQLFLSSSCLIDEVSQTTYIGPYKGRPNNEDSNSRVNERFPIQILQVSKSIRDVFVVTSYFTLYRPETSSAKPPYVKPNLVVHKQIHARCLIQRRPIVAMEIPY